MDTNIIFYALLRTTLFLTVSGAICFLALCRLGDRIPRLSRVLWLAVLLSGWCWVQPVVMIPWLNPTSVPVPISAPIAVETPIEETPAVVESHIVKPQPVNDFYPPIPNTQSLSPIFPALTLGASNTPPPVPQPPAPKPQTLIPALLLIWFSGIVVSIFLALFGYVRFLLTLRKTAPASDDFAGPWCRLLELHDIAPRTIPMFVSQDDPTFGPALIRTILGYRLVVPYELWSELSEAGRIGILKHELAHFQRRDVWKSFFVRILVLPHWFNPMAHLALHRFDEAAEQLCDRAAFEMQEDGVIEFARTLLLLHENAPTQFVARQSIFGRGLKHRVACLLLENHTKKVSTMKKILLACGMLAVLAAGMFRVQLVEKIVAQNTQEQNIATKIPEPQNSQPYPAGAYHGTAVPPAENDATAENVDVYVIDLFLAEAINIDPEESLVRMLLSEAINADPNESLVKMLATASANSGALLKEAFKKREEEGKIMIMTRPQITVVPNTLAFLMFGSKTDYVTIGFELDEQEDSKSVLAKIQIEKHAEKEGKDTVVGRSEMLATVLDGQSLISAGELDGRQIVLLATMKKVPKKETKLPGVPIRKDSDSPLGFFRTEKQYAPDEQRPEKEEFRYKVGGKVLMPDGTPAKKGTKVFYQFHSYQSIFSGTITDENGYFKTKDMPQLENPYVSAVAILPDENPENGGLASPVTLWYNMEQMSQDQFELRLQKGVIVQGTVTQEGKPVPKALLLAVLERDAPESEETSYIANNVSLWTGCDEQGNYRFIFPSGGFRIYFNDTPWDQTSGDATESNDGQTVDIEIPPQTRLRAVQSDGKPLIEAELYWLYVTDYKKYFDKEEQQERWASVYNNQLVRTDGAGNYRFYASSLCNIFRYETETEGGLLVLEGEENIGKEHTLTLRPFVPGKIRYVSKESGEPVVGVKVHWEPVYHYKECCREFDRFAFHKEFETTTDAQGYAHFPKLIAGESYRITLFDKFPTIPKIGTFDAFHFKVETTEREKDLGTVSLNGDFSYDTVTPMKENSDVGVKAESFQNQLQAYQNAFDAINGDITKGSFEQKHFLLHYTIGLASMYMEKGETEKALQKFAEFEKDFDAFVEQAQRMENTEVKEKMLELASNFHDSFVGFGKYEKAIAVAKMTPLTGQYNASEYLTRVAKLVAHRDGFQKAIPILDESQQVAKDRLSGSWKNRAVVDVAEVYEEAGHTAKARELVDTLPADSQASGLLALVEVRKKKGKIAETIPMLIEAEVLAEAIIDKDKRSSTFYFLARYFIDGDQLEKGLQLFEKSDYSVEEYYKDDIQIHTCLYWLRKNNVTEAEKTVDKATSDTTKARILLYILREKKKTLGVAEFKRLLDKAEPYVWKVMPYPHRLHDLMRVAAYRIRIGETEKGEKLIAELVQTSEKYDFDRDEALYRAMIGLTRANLYDRAREQVEKMASPGTQAAALESLERMRLDEENPEEYKKLVNHWNVPDDSANAASGTKPAERVYTPAMSYESSAGPKAIKTHDNIKGRIVDEKGNPLQGVRIHVEAQLDNREKREMKIDETKTDAEGRFDLAGPFLVYHGVSEYDGTPSWWNGPMLTISLPGRQHVQQMITTESNEFNVTLERGVKIRGQVIDDRTGKGAANIDVTFFTMDMLGTRPKLVTKTDAEGSYETDFYAAPDRYLIFVLDQSYPRNTQSDETVGKLEGVDVTLDAPVFQAPELHVNQCGWIEVEFVDSVTKKPVGVNSLNIDHACVGETRYKGVIFTQQPYLFISGSRFKIKAFPGDNVLRILSDREGGQIADLNHNCTSVISVKPGETVSRQFDVVSRENITAESLGKLPEPVEAEREAAEAVKRFGGWYQVDSENHVIAVNMVYRDRGSVRYDNMQKGTDAVMPFLPKFSRLKNLFLRQGQATNDSAVYFAKLENLENLWFWDAHITDEGIKHLGGLQKLRKIHIDNAGLTDASMEVFSKLPNIRELSLQQNRFTNRGLEYLQNSQTLKTLWWCLGDTKVNDESLAILAKFPALAEVIIQGTNDITTVGIEALSAAPRLRKITLNLGDSIQNVDIDRAEKAFAKMKTLEKLEESEGKLFLSLIQAEKLAKALPNLKELGKWNAAQLQRLREK